MLLHLRDLDAAVSGGVLYVTVGDIAFPEEDWYDLVSADLENWLPVLISFAREHTDSCLLKFMDAPAAVRLTRQNGDIYVVCSWNQKPQIGETEIDFPIFLKSVAKCIRRYNRALHERGKTTQFAVELSVIKTILTNYP